MSKRWEWETREWTTRDGDVVLIHYEVEEGDRGTIVPYILGCFDDEGNQVDLAQDEVQRFTDDLAECWEPEEPDWKEDSER